MDQGVKDQKNRFASGGIFDGAFAIADGKPIT